MRVTGGRLRGRRLRAPGGGVRPTQDRVREALFALLGARIAGRRFLDLFAGSGAVGIEAWSRGASFVCLVESSRRVLPVLRENVRLVEGGAAEVRGADAFRFLRGGGGAARFDVIFADPPYAAVRGSAGRAFTARLLAGIAGGGGLAPDGLVVLEGAAGAEVPAEPGWRRTDERRYGSVGVTFLVRA